MQANQTCVWGHSFMKQMIQTNFEKLTGSRAKIGNCALYNNNK